MSKAPYFPFYVRNWLCSRTVVAMPGAAVKAYLYLLSEAWLQTPRATLPNDDGELASMARVSAEDWASIKNDILRAFKIGECEEHKGRLFNETQLEISRKWENNQRHNNKNAKRTRIKREVNAPLKEIAIAIPSSLSSSSSFLSSWDEWVIYRKKIKKTMTPMTQEKQLSKMAKWGPDRAIAAINLSIEKGWTGIFEPKKDDSEGWQ
jgi:uncharacterized protein YdaU (DUF1376 family)